MHSDSLTITDNRTGKAYTLPIANGAIRAMDLRQIRTGPEDFGLLSYDPAFTNTASTVSRITEIDGDQGILRYRGYPIEELAERSNYLEVAYLLLNGELPTLDQMDDWVWQITHHTWVHENVKKFMDGFHHDAHPMGMLISTVAALSTFYPEARDALDPETAPAPDHPAHRQDADPGGLRLPSQPGAAVRLSRQRALLHRQLPEHALQDHRGEVPAQPDHRAGAGGAVHPPRRPRAELLDQCRAQRGLVPGGPVLGAGRGRGRALRPAPRRRQRGSAPDAPRRSAPRTGSPSSSGR